MAGGLGKRMNSDIPKVLHKIHEIPMICHLIKTAREINPKKILIVVGNYKSIIESTILNYTHLNNIEFVYQSCALGTGHAILCCLNNILNENCRVLILSGDTPFVSSDTMHNMLKSDAIIMTTEYTEDCNIFCDYGKIIEKDNNLNKIIEKKDCNLDELLIKKVNCGIYSFSSKLLCKYIPLITNNNSQKEYYLTDVIEIIKTNENINIDMYNLSQTQQYEIIGVNTKEQLEELSKLVIFNK